MGNQQKKVEQNQLSADWFLSGRVDTEQKKYVLLAYLKKAEKAFHYNQLYPYLSELVFHYRNLKQFMDKKNNLYQQFPQELRGVDLQKLKLYYHKVIEDDELMKRLEEIVQNSIEEIKPYLDEGKEIFDFVENHLELKQVGLISINPEKGYLFIRNGDQQVTQVYYYKVKQFKLAKDNMKGITAKYLASFKRRLTNTYESIKKELVKNYHEHFTSPASYAIESPFNFPENETLLPIAKRVLIRHIYSE